MRERIDVSEIEAKTKIRAKYLRALENEEWDLLPGPTFVKSFLRTYAQALGLDDKALLEEYKLHYEHPGDVPELIQQPARRARQRRTTPGAPAGGPSRGYVVAVSVIGLVIVLLLIGLLGGGGGGGGSSDRTANTTAHKPAARQGRGTGAARRTSVSTLASLRLEPSAPVYVCLIGDGERKRIPGLILQPGQAQPTYHARRFELTLGNNSLTLFVNGRAVTVPASSAAIGYAITRTGMRKLAAGELPTCQ